MEAREVEAAVSLPGPSREPDRGSGEDRAHRAARDPIRLDGRLDLTPREREAPGSDRYAKASRTHGVTTLSRRHVTGTAATVAPACSQAPCSTTTSVSTWARRSPPGTSAPGGHADCRDRARRARRRGDGRRSEEDDRERDEVCRRAAREHTGGCTQHVREPSRRRAVSRRTNDRRLPPAEIARPKGA